MLLDELELEIQCSNECGVELPEIANICNPEPWYGRINEVLFIPCDEVIDEAWVLDLANWTQQFVTVGYKGRRTGKGIGGMAQVNATAIDTGANCGIPTLVGSKFTWEITFRQVIIDKSAQFTTHVFANTLQAGALNSYKLFVRVCDEPDTIYPIGKVALSKFNNTLPEGVDEFMTIEYGFQWKQKGLPMPIHVAGLSTVLGS